MRKNLLAILSAAALSEGAATQQPPTPDGAERERDFSVSYLKMKEREFAESNQALTRLQRLPAQQGILSVLRTQNPFAGADVIGGDSQRRTQVRSALTETVAYYLASVGFLPNDIRRLQRSGLDPLASATKTVSARPDLMDRIVVGEEVAIGEIVSARRESEQSPLVAVTVRLNDVLKGSAAPGALRTVTTVAGLDGTGNQNSVPGQQYLLFLSDSLLHFRRARGDDLIGSGDTIQQMAPYRIDQGQLIAIHPSQQGTEMPIAQLKAMIEPHRAALESN